MYITEVSIKRPVVAWVLSLILIVFGLFVYSELPVRELPDGLQPPVVQVKVDYKSASAPIVDQEITQVIEDVIGGAEGIKNIDSKSENGRSSINIEFDTYRYIRKSEKAKAVKTKSGKMICRWAQLSNNEKSIMPAILEELLKARKATKKLMKGETDPFMENILDKRQLGYKVTANSLYGQCGAKTSTFYEKDVAASTTATGRMMIIYAKRMVEEVYGNTIYETKENIKLPDIINIVASELNIKPSDIKSKKRTATVANARRVVIYLARELTHNSMPDIAKFVGMKDHSSISHNIKKANELIEKDENFKLIIENLKNKIINKEW